MRRIVLHIYDAFSRYRTSAWTLFAIITCVLLWQASRISFSEDISDFLPLDDMNREALDVYQDISGADRIYALVSSVDTIPDPDRLTEAVDRYAGMISSSDSSHSIVSVFYEIDPDMIDHVMESVYSLAPVYMTDGDMARADSLLSIPGYIGQQIKELRQILSLPVSSYTSLSARNDPLGLFSPVVDRLQRSSAGTVYETYDGYIFTPDQRAAVVVIESAAGSSESDSNAILVDMLTQKADELSESMPDVSVRLTGAPVIAVENARCIKSDSFMAIAVAVVLILVLLIYVFRSFRNLFLILLSVGWGWLFSIGMISLSGHTVSIIVVGIGSIIVGISVNYPLHLIDHLRFSPDRRAALAEITPPLLTGNITTIGAFLCLVPLDSPALRDLGVFSSLLLAGTIFFVLLVLPHLVACGADLSCNPRRTLIDRFAALPVYNSKRAGWAVVALTCLFAVFSTRTGFDTDLRDISYMSPSQRADLQALGQIVPGDTMTTVYLASSAATYNDAFRRNESVNHIVDSIVVTEGVKVMTDMTFMMPSDSMAELRLTQWAGIVDSHRDILTDTLALQAEAAGFDPSAFNRFLSHICTTDHTCRPDTVAIGSVFPTSLSHDSRTGRHTVVRTLAVPPGKVSEIEATVNTGTTTSGVYCFDVAGINAAMTSSLSGSFNFIGIACSVIVFVFLWLSFRSLRLALVAFLPMAVSWIWILGIMAIIGLQFNIVNVILATFIFGQGDDYTIFVTDGLIAEAQGRKVIASFRSSIILSALIMFIGIGVLAFASHPVLRSLGEVTLAGMLSVVTVSFLLPPLLFRILSGIFKQKTL